MVKENMNAKEAQSEMKGQFTNKDKIKCKDCIFRDHTTVEIGEKEIPVGVTKAYCDAYQAPPVSNGKPHDVLFNNGDCEFYAKEE